MPETFESKTVAEPEIASDVKNEPAMRFLQDRNYVPASGIVI